VEFTVDTVVVVIGGKELGGRDAGGDVASVSKVGVPVEVVVVNVLGALLPPR
jgi:hypothetical protein